jgi:hypothetical protein
MAQRAPASNSRQPARQEPLYDINPLTGASIEVFYADRMLETFGKCGGVGFGGRVGVAARQMARLLGRSLRATQRIGTP